MKNTELRIFIDGVQIHLVVDPVTPPRTGEYILIPKPNGEPDETLEIYLAKVTTLYPNELKEDARTIFYCEGYLN